MNSSTDTWSNGDPYEYFMGRWSKLMAPVFLQWLNAAYGLSWLDIGCGTGALSEVISLTCNPASISCVDPSAAFLEKAKERFINKADFTVGSASAIPKPDNSFDIIVSGLALNFFPDLPAAFSEMKRVHKKDGMIAAYVWDYAGRMDLLRIFWDAAREIDPQAYKFDEGLRFPVCNEGKLKESFQQAGLTGIQTSNLDIITVFKNFDDYWNPFLGGQGPAPGYLAFLNKGLQEELENNVRKKLSPAKDGSIKLTARAIAVKGIVRQVT
ncbi:MAG: class I SAM-dependent methyltransferase [Chitinophagaceae bacterium]|nr:class I SAM-dependent methyltransferase [Chitinophagaceae bacterium]